jgi:hypothetical protein
VLDVRVRGMDVAMMVALVIRMVVSITVPARRGGAIDSDYKAFSHTHSSTPRT